jgi:hypothetical protein
MVRKAYTTFVCLYLLPGEYAAWLTPRAEGGRKLPTTATMERHLPSERLLRREMDAVENRADEATRAIIRARDTWGGASHCSTLSRKATSGCCVR